MARDRSVSVPAAQIIALGLSRQKTKQRVEEMLAQVKGHSLRHGHAAEFGLFIQTLLDAGAELPVSLRPAKSAEPPSQPIAFGAGAGARPASAELSRQADAPAPVPAAAADVRATAATVRQGNSSPDPPSGCGAMVLVAIVAIICVIALAWGVGFFSCAEA